MYDRVLYFLLVSSKYMSCDGSMHMFHNFFLICFYLIWLVSNLLKLPMRAMLYYWDPCFGLVCGTTLAGYLQVFYSQKL